VWLVVADMQNAYIGQMGYKAGLYWTADSPHEYVCQVHKNRGQTMHDHGDLQGNLVNIAFSAATDDRLGSLLCRQAGCRI
jgi:hypothetical protein